MRMMMMMIIIIIITSLVRRSVEKLNQEIIQEDLILKGMRRNGMLSFRPCKGAGQLVKAETQAWTKDMPEGSHRIKAKWLDHRYDWLQADGRPEIRGWKSMKLAKRIRDMEDHEFCAAENDRIHLSSLEEDFPANEGPDLEEWSLMEEADWSPMEEETRYELSAAYQERKAIEEAIRLQVPPCKVRIMEEVDALMSSKGPEREANPKAKAARKAYKRKMKAMTQAALKANLSRFKDRRKEGSSVADALAAIPLRTSKGGKDTGGKAKKKRGTQGGQAG